MLTVTPIVLFNFHENIDIISDLSDQLIDQATATVIEKTANHFLPASLAVEMSSRLTELGAISSTNHDQLERFVLGVVKSHPQVSMFFFGDEQGSYFRAWELADGTMETRIIERNGSAVKETFKYWDTNFRISKVLEAEGTDYDPRVRPWYMGAKEKKTCYWTEMYILFRNQAPAVTSAYPVYDETGGLRGVWGMDIELDEMSLFLNKLEISKNSVVFIFDSKNEIVAYPDPEISLVVKDEQGAFRPVRVEELGVDPVTVAFREYVSTGKSKSVVETGGKRYFSSFTPFPESFLVSWKVGMVVPAEDYVGGAKMLMAQSMAICLIILCLAVLIAVLVSRSITGPIRILAEETRKIKDFHLDDRIEVDSRIHEIQSMISAISAMKTGLQAFRRYVPAELVRQLVHSGEEARPGGHKRELTVFFSDVAGFTTIAERMRPEDLMRHLSEYFDELTRILSDHKGTVDKYIGDGILAFWGAPVPDADHAFNACMASLLCRKKLVELHEKWRREGTDLLFTRIGISTGESIVGNVGSSERINYTVIGDNVNLASRLEGANKFFGTNIIVSQKTYETVSDKFWFRPLGIIAVKGKHRDTNIFELMDKKEGGEIGPTGQLCKEFSLALEAYLAREWEAAHRRFTELSLKYPSDAPTILYLSRCIRHMNTPPGPDWRGLEHLESK